MACSNSYWRNIAAPIINRAILENRDKDLPEIRKALREAYPFGERRMHPYKIWCSEVRRQLGLGEHNTVCTFIPDDVLKNAFKMSPEELKKRVYRHEKPI